MRGAASVDYEYSTWYGFLAPAKTPVPALQLLSRTILQIAEDKDVKDRYRAQGVNIRNVVLRDFDAYIKTDMEKLGPLVKASGAKAN